MAYVYPRRDGVFLAELEPSYNRGFDLATQGRTEAEAIANLREALELRLEGE